MARATDADVGPSLHGLAPQLLPMGERKMTTILACIGALAVFVVCIAWLCVQRRSKYQRGWYLPGPEFDDRDSIQQFRRRLKT